MRRIIYFLSFLALIIIATGPRAHADVSPGDLIDKTNWQKVEGMVPQPVIDWLKKGDIVLPIGELNYDPGKLANAHVMKTFESNKDKYTIKEGNIVLKSTGKMPDFIEGIPFPEFDANDRLAAEKHMYNRLYRTQSVGNLEIPEWQLHWMTRDGLIRTGAASYYQYPFDGWGGARDYPNPEGLQRYQIYKFLEPYDIAGTAQMSWRYKAADKRDKVFGFLPSIRRCRRLTPANRSDGILGSDAVYDDSWGFDAKVPDFEWKVIEVKEGLIPYHSKDMQPLEKAPGAGWKTTQEFRDVVMGYDDPDWPGAPWFQTNLIWVKRPIFVLEAKSTDPYYNLGIQYLWIDAETSMGMVKVMHDRAGKYWKTGIITDLGLSTPDGKVRFNIYRLQLFVDDRNDRATLIDTISSENPWTFFGDVDPNIFSITGFTRFCK